MKTLLILRHAKSSWDDPAVPDHDRPLTQRGKQDAKRVGQLLQEHGLGLGPLLGGEIIGKVRA